MAQNFTDNSFLKVCLRVDHVHTLNIVNFVNCSGLMKPL